MSGPHRATPEQWDAIASLTGVYPGAWGDCILELRARIAAAEQRISEQNGALLELASTVAKAGNDHEQRITELESKQDTQRVGMLDVYQHLDKLKTQHESNWSRIVKLEEAADHLQDATEKVPAGSLVEVVQLAIGNAPFGPDEACAAILAVADWLELRGTGTTTGPRGARWLRDEVARNA